MKLKRLCAGIASILALIFVGCSNALTDAGRISGSDAPCTVDFSVTNIPTDYNKMIRTAQNPGARTILPNAPFDFSTTTPTITFVLSGKSNIGGTLPNTTVALDSTTHNFKVTLPAHVWDLTLTAYRDYNPGDTHHKPVLQGHCMVDLTNGDGTADFNMSTNGLKTPGTVKLTGAVLDPDDLCKKYKVGIYDAYSRKLIDKYVDYDGTTGHNTNAEQTHEVKAADKTTAGQFSFHYGDTSYSSPADLEVKLNPGAYSLEMVFYKDGATPGTFIPIGNYTDTIIVYPGNDLDRIVQPNPLDVLNKKPTDPKDLRAYLVKDSEGTEGSYYCTKLTWDSSMFETNYELEVSIYADDGTTPPSITPPISGSIKTYGFKTTNNAVDENFAGSAIRYGGSLISGSHDCTLKLELGKVYEVRLRAVNYLGTSQWISRTVAAPAIPPADCQFFDIPTPATPKKHINRRRLRYNLNGGKLTLDVGGTPTVKEGVYIEYKSYDGTEQDLLKITPSTPTPPAHSNTLVKPSTPPSDFAGWLNPNTGRSVSYDHTSPTPTTDPNCYKHINVDLTTDFGNGLEGTVAIPPTVQDIAAGKIKITYDKDGGTSPTDPVLSGIHYVIPKKLSSGDITFIKVEFNNLTPANEYTDMECSAYFTTGSVTAVNKVDFVSAADGNSCVFSTAAYPTQTFTLKVSAKNQSGIRLSNTFLIDLSN